MTNRKTCKAAIPMALMLCCASLLTTPVSAIDCETPISPTSGAYVAEREETIFPYYVALLQLDAELSIDSSGYAVCIGTATARLDYTCDATLELQQKNGSTWETIKDWSSSGRNNDFNENWYVKSGCDYRIRITAEVRASAGKLIESPSKYSSIVHY